MSPLLNLRFFLGLETWMNLKLQRLFELTSTTEAEPNNIATMKRFKKTRLVSNGDITLHRTNITSFPQLSCDIQPRFLEV